MYISNLIFKRKSQFGFRQSSISVCVVGSGPAGYYAVAALLKKPNVAFDVTIFDKQPTPFGLVRTGVAPDHPEVKLVQNRFTDSSNEPNVHFYGNVEVGKDISVEELKQQFQVVIFAYGCGQSNRLNIEGANARGVYNATDFTNWYNGAPLHFHTRPVELKGDSAVIIGNGNVAIDVARILSRSESELKQTDIPTPVLAQLAQSKVNNIHIVGRRGPIQASFTTAELRELASVVNVKMDLGSCKDAIESASSQEELKDRLHHRKFQLIQNLQGQKYDERMSRGGIFLNY